MKNSYLLLHIAVILAGFTGIFGKLIALNEGILTWYRLIISAIILFALMQLRNIKSKICWKEKLHIAKVGMFISVHWIFFYASIKYSNISIGVICYCLTSFFTAVFKPIIDRSPFKYSELLLSALTLFGISLIFHLDSSFQLGIILGLISSAFAAIYTIYNERLVKKYNSLQINYFQMLGGSIGVGILVGLYLLFFPVPQIIPSPRDLVYLLLLSLFCTVALYVIFAEVLKKIPAFTVNLSFNLEPVYAIILALLFFDESKELNFSFYMGLLFIILSVGLQSVFSYRQQK